MHQQHGQTRKQRLRPQVHRSYTVFEAAVRLGVDRNTIRRWIRQGLETIDTRRPILIQGRALLAFLERRRTAAKRPCQPGTLYCFKCREPKRPALGMVEFVITAGPAGNLVALCETCGTMMNRRCPAGRISTVMPMLEVTTRQG